MVRVDQSRANVSPSHPATNVPLPLPLSAARLHPVHCLAAIAGPLICKEVTSYSPICFLTPTNLQRRGSNATSGAYWEVARSQATTSQYVRSRINFIVFSSFSAQRINDCPMWFLWGKQIPSIVQQTVDGYCQIVVEANLVPRFIADASYLQVGRMMKATSFMLMSEIGLGLNHSI